MAMAILIKAVNDTAGPDRLVPTLLAYGAYLRMSNLDPPAPSIMDQATVIQKIIAEMAKLQVIEWVERIEDKMVQVTWSIRTQQD